MIKEITIQGVIPYNTEPQKIEPKYINFIFGLNGCGKTTLSRLIANYNSIHSNNCNITWSDHPLKCLVYNKDFIKENFDESSAPGIFTLGKDNIEINKKIADCEERINELINNNLSLTSQLNAPLTGISTQIQNLNYEYLDEFWKEKQRIDKEDRELIPYLEGVRNSKELFKKKLLDEYKNNKEKELEIQELKNLCTQLNKSNAEKYNPINIPSFNDLHHLEDNPIFKRKITGRDDSEIAGLIKKLNNEGWFKQGIQYITKSEKTCPFCQRPLEEDFLRQIEEYFDESYATAISELNKAYKSYIDIASRTLSNIDTITFNHSNFVELDSFTPLKQELKEIITKNKNLLESKLKSPEISIQMHSTRECTESITKFIHKTNTLIENHNKRIDNIRNERFKLTKQIWRYIISNLKKDISAYLQNLNKLTSLESKISNDIKANNNCITSQKESLFSLRSQTSSIYPTAEKINNYLQKGGITSFKIEVEEQTKKYKFVRNNGSETNDTLSEGERNLVTFLYFFCSIEGNKEQNSQDEDKVIFIDDPVSSLDSNILFFVSALIRTLFKETYDATGRIKQIFISSHNSFFFREVSYERGISRNKTTYWMITKNNNSSKITKHNSNPVTSTYEMLWREIRNAKENPTSHSNISLANTMRRILEYYFDLLGKIDLSEKVFNELPTEDKVIYKSLTAWLNSGSHAYFEDYSVEAFTADAEKYLSVFKKVFDLTHHTAHYDMMMNPPERK